uniref:EF-hand domain-containing protein n=1 Tax=Guillardia theta TaxID=55529 RepID=A0A7S4NY08_GUITH|mmetsp:Transcript_38325/g.120659  ORF Transcript_38325/g.120659 Transcript_38325/m.120659 type:complete len:601 (+) Transcript_38325:181-1983(+)
MLSCPEAVCLSGEGSIIVLDSAKSSVFKVSSSDKVEILAGIGMSGYSDGSTSQGSSKHDAPDHVPAAFSHPRGMSIDESGNIFVCDTGNHCIRGISVHGRITTMAGTAQSPGSADGPALSSSFNQPWCCVSGRFHEEDCLYICDSGNDSIRCLHADEGGAMVKTIVGSTSQQHNRNKLKFPWSIAYVDNLLYVGDKYNYRLVELSPEKGEILRSISDLWPSSLRFAPRGIAISDDGNMYLTDSWNCKVWRWKVDGTEALQEVAGSGIRSHRDGRGEFAQFLYPSGIAVESASSVVVCDTGNQCLRRCKMLRDDEVKEKMKKLVQSINTRNIRQAIITWAVASQTDSTTWQPFDVVLSLALGSIGSDSSECPLKVFEDRSPDLRAMVETIARVLQWRVVKSRSQAEFENSLEMSDEERRAKIVEAKQIFDTYDQDGGGSIDAQELKEALAAADVEMSEEEVASLLEEYDEDGSGTISFEEFCQMQGLSLTDTEREEFLPSSSDDATGVDSDHSELPDTAAQSRNRQEEIAPSEENSEKQGAEQKAAGSRKSSEQRVDENKSKKSVPAADQVKSAVADSSRTSKPSAASSDKLASQTQTRKK